MLVLYKSLGAGLKFYSWFSLEYLPQPLVRQKSHFMTLPYYWQPASNANLNIIKSNWMFIHRELYYAFLITETGWKEFLHYFWLFSFLWRSSFTRQYPSTSQTGAHLRGHMCAGTLRVWCKASFVHSKPVFFFMCRLWGNFSETVEIPWGKPTSLV